MTSEPLVSIVTPCLNPGERLAGCLDSVAAQTYPHVEHVVVDGGSTDGTPELLRKRGVRFVSEPDEGQAHAINKGFGLAEGDWLGWLNADDLLTPRATELAMTAAAANPATGWIYGKCEIRRDSGDLVFEPPAHIDRRTLQDRNMLAQPGTLVARWALDRVGLLDQQFDLAMDFDLWLRLVEVEIPSVYVPEVLAIFEIHGASKTGSVAPREFALESAAAMFKCGRLSDGSAVLGRTAARSAHTAESPIDRNRLESEIARVVAYGTELVPRLDADLVRAAAYAEAAERELFLPGRRYRYLLSPEAWRVSRTRKHLAYVLAAAAVRRVKRPRRRPVQAAAPRARVGTTDADDRVRGA